MAVIVYYGGFSSFSDPENWIASAIDRAGHACVRLHRDALDPKFDRVRVLEVLRSHGAGALLLTKCPEINHTDLVWLRARWAGVIAFWTFDWMLHEGNWAWYQPLASVADICFQTDGFVGTKPTDPPAFKSYAGIRRFELHQGFDPEIHVPPKQFTEKDEELARDVVFCGSVYTDRRQDLIKQMYRYDFAHYGAPERQVWGRQFAGVCGLSKIMIGDNYTNDVPGYWSDRVYLTLACGGFFLTAYVEGLEHKFKNHEHLVWWHDWAELHAMIQHYLPREAARRRIAANGMALVRGRDSYDHRIAELVETIKRMGRRP